ncbi:MAG TPA: FHA domain-containing protein [candidate division WOR-3 bacterium]|uniref:FHA domain-containing protein n=1 Tax=candidate division WOR-3 bacterium TaxID=2052148 RepID=A0A7V0XF67_UNCW3|nr:FHA domain-containing protein [candidate division WOR-3 bacterium]
MMRLLVLAGPDRGRSWTLKPGENRLGRRPDGEIALSDRHVSGSHATLVVGPDGVELRDHSKNGTVVNGRNHGGSGSSGAAVLLRPGDRLKVGLTELRLEMPAPARTAPPPDDDLTVVRETPVPGKPPGDSSRPGARRDDSGPYRPVAPPARRGAARSRPVGRTPGKEEDSGAYRPVPEPAKPPQRASSRSTPRREAEPEPAQADDPKKKLLKRVLVGLGAFVLTIGVMVMITPEVREGLFGMMCTRQPQQPPPSPPPPQQQQQQQTPGVWVVDITSTWQRIEPLLSGLPDEAARAHRAGWNSYQDRMRQGSGSYHRAAENWNEAARLLSESNPELAQDARNLGFTARAELYRYVDQGIRDVNLLVRQESPREARKLAEILLADIVDHEDSRYKELKKIVADIGGTR